MRSVEAPRARLQVGLCALALAALVSVTTAHAAGSWVAEAIAPTLRQNQRIYDSAPLKPRSTTPLHGDAIRSVSWQYDFSRWISGRKAVLCGGGRCIDASAERGSSRAFAGLPVATVFQFRFRVAGEGMLAPPIEGHALQLVVNFE